MFSEVTEVRDAVHLLTPRAINADVGRDLVREMRWYDEYLAARLRRPQRQSHAGQQARRPGERGRESARLGGEGGQHGADGGRRPRRKSHRQRAWSSPPRRPSDFICGTQQLACSMNVHLFTTGEGTPYGLALAPVIKISSRTALAERWPDLIDLDAGRIATGDATIESVGWELFRLILDVASGRKKTWADHWGLHNALSPFNPGPVT